MLSHENILAATSAAVLQVKIAVIHKLNVLAANLAAFL